MSIKLKYFNFYTSIKTKKPDIDTTSVTKTPFFISSSKNGKKLKLNNKTISKKNQLFYNKLSSEIQLLYSGLGENQEGSLASFTFLTLEEIINRSNNFKHFFDIGLMHIGMGFVWILSYYPKDKKFFFRVGGGGCSYERENSYLKYKNYDPKLERKEEDETIVPENVNKLLTFDEVLQVFHKWKLY
tara:strand:+ start:767 stop:1324 length:558 start_codon:yes stop_codon:yes gene_type:complete